MYPVIDMKRTGERIRQIMERKKVTPKDIQKYMNLSCVQTVYHWLDGTSIPSIDNLYALSSLFKMPMDALVCGNRPSIILPHDEEFFMRGLSYYMRILEMQAA